MKQLRFRVPSTKVLLPVFMLLYSCQQKEVSLSEPVVARTNLMLSEAQMQLANIQIAEVSSGEIGRELLLTGVLKIDEQSVVSISSRTAGRIQKLYLKNTGEPVKKGDPLYDFYSEELLTLQREYKSLQDNNWNFLGRSDRSIAVENKLLLQGMLPSQIAQLKTSKYLFPVITIYSTESGIIRSVNVTEGQYVDVGQQIYELADNAKIWAEAQVYPNELPYISVGMAADVIVPVAGNLHIPNRISFINPAFEPGSNVTLVRAIINNPGKLLHPGMHALISIQTQKDKGIVIPASAVLIEKQGSLVWVQNEDGSFIRKKIKTGIQSADSVLVLSGLNESEKLVVSGVYLLNSEKILNKGNETENENELVEMTGQMEK